MGPIFTLVFFAIFFLVFFAARNKTLGQVQALDRLQQAGLPGRGLVLSSAMMATGTTINGRRFEQRQMTLDVEVYGRAPYVIQGIFTVPRGLVEAIPGSSLELAVDPSNPNQVAILGPGGFTGPWLNLGPPRPY
jgi:hypothetical protein